jgi:oxysterol-binding protein 1
MEGYLKKWINLLYGWQSRYFIIHEGVLIYCLQKDKPKKGQVHLSICSIRLVPSDPLRIVINYGMNEMHLRASSVQEKQKWYEALLGHQEQSSPQRRYSLLQQNNDHPFATLAGAPRMNLNRIHTTLTKIWVA